MWTSGFSPQEHIHYYALLWRISTLSRAYQIDKGGLSYCVIRRGCKGRPPFLSDYLPCVAMPPVPRGACRTALTGGEVHERKDTSILAACANVQSGPSDSGTPGACRCCSVRFGGVCGRRG